MTTTLTTPEMYTRALTNLHHDGLVALERSWVTHEVLVSFNSQTPYRQPLLEKARALFSRIPQQDGAKLELLQFRGEDSYSLNIDLSAWKGGSVSLPENLPAIMKSMTMACPTFLITVTAQSHGSPAQIQYRPSGDGYTVLSPRRGGRATLWTLTDALNHATRSMARRRGEHVDGELPAFEFVSVSTPIA